MNENSSNNELLKEQLRRKEIELRKRDLEKKQVEARLQNIIAINKKTVTALQEEIENRTAALKANEQKKQSEKKSETSSPPAVQVLTLPREAIMEGSKGTVKEAPNKTLDPKIIQGIQLLRTKNRELSLQVQEEQKKQMQLLAEKKGLLEEINDLRDQPDLMRNLKLKNVQLEEELEKTTHELRQLVESKEELILTYEKVLQENFGEGSQDTREGWEILEALHRELEQLRTEREKLEKDLNKEKNKFADKLTKEIKRLEEEWGDKLKKFRRIRKSTDQFADEVMESDSGSPAWMTTFADMTTLLLTFFILYYSISSVNLNRFKEAIMGEENASIGLLEVLDATQIKEKISELSGMRSKNILDDIKVVADQSTPTSPVSVFTDRSKIVVRVPGEALFQAGGADLQKSTRSLLDEVASVIKNYPQYKINIQGHTDDSPIQTERFPTNWELSAGRATAVLRYFIDRGIEAERLTATGYADMFQISSNDSEAGRAKNRRVEIVLEKQK